MQAYKIISKTYTEAGNIDFDENTNSINFINTGATVVTINDNVELANNASISFDGNASEVDLTGYKVHFTGAGANELIVTKKIFV